jgi:hypothetical protein
MIPAVTEIKTEPKKEQQQNTDVQPNSPQEASPEIKSEENKTNWKAFREQREADRKAREEAEKRAQSKQEEAAALKAALEAITNKPSQNHNHDAGDIEDTEQERIDRRVKQIIADREAEAEKQRLQREQQEAPQRIVQTFPDFNKVVTTENCDYLDYHYPELTAPFRYMPDGYDKWVAMYNAIRKFVPNLNDKKDMAKVEKNLQKPGSISSAGTTTGTGQVPSARLDEAKKSANWERMQSTLKRLS